MSKVEVQMVTNEVAGIKDNMWKLTGRIQLMEKFIQKQFGDVFWDFVQEHADSDYEISRSPTPPIAPSVTVTLIQPSSGASSSASSESSPSNNNNSNSSSAPPPPPPLIPASSLASLTQGGNRVGPRNFLPKSLASNLNVKSKPVLRATGSPQQILQGARKSNSSPTNSVEDKRPIIKTVKSIGGGGGESILKSSLRPVVTTTTTVSNNNNRMRPAAPSLRPGSTPPTKPLVLKRVAPIDLVKVDEDYEPPEKRSSSNSIDYDMVSYTQPNRSVKILRTSAGIKAETDGYSAAHNGFLREMRPNPCHTRCQNRCHDIWTDQDRMDVFQTYWSIPTEDDRRQWVAERIERVDMATKKTEYSNFRTCTFKYYFPHPENPRVQVCKNFFLATIDEKRSYVEKIAQEVKGFSEHYSIQDIPFRRKNQMKGSNGNGGGYNMGQYDQDDDNYVVGWMTGGMDGQDQDDDYGDDDNGEDVDGMEHVKMDNMDMEDIVS